MSGRHAGWRRLLGDTAERPDLLDFGKKLLAYLENQRALSGVQTLSIQRELEDGSVVMARLVGGLPEIYVRAAPDGEGEAPAPKIACNPRNSDFPSGRDPLWTQVGLTPRAGPWGAWFGSRLAGDLVAPPKALYTRAFPDGIKRGGNCDWRGADGVVVSFYGPTLRYLYDPYRKPDKQYGRWVFMNGDAVLDVAEYDTANSLSTPETLVLGAALVGNDLYVMQANIGAFADDPGAEFAGTTPDGAAAWISPVYPPGTTDLKLYRYAVARVDTSPQKAGRAKVVDGSRTLLWSKTARGYVNPWVANPDATVWETFALPEETRRIAWRNYNGHLVDVPPDPEIVLCAPSETSKHTTLAISGGGVSESTVDVSHEFAGEYEDVDGFDGQGVFDITATFAADYDAQGNRIEGKLRMHSEPGPDSAPNRPVFLSIGGVEHAMFLEDDLTYWYGAQLMGLDLRTKSAALLVRAYPTWRWRVIVNDAEVHAVDTGYPTAANGTLAAQGQVYSYNGRSAGYFVNFLPFYDNPGPSATVRPLSPLAWAYLATANKAINYKPTISAPPETRYSASQSHLAAYMPLVLPNAELVIKSNTAAGSTVSWQSGSGAYSFLATRLDADNHAVPCSLLVDRQFNWLFSGVAGLHYVVDSDHRMRFPTLYAGSTDLPARTGIGPEAAGEPTNTYGPMWLFSKY